MDLNLKNKKALVLGSSQGIGKEVARSLKNEGCIVCLSSRNETKLSQVKDEINADYIIAGDLSKEGEGSKIISQAIKLLNGVDIIVYNTGGPQKGAFNEISLTQWKEDYQSLHLSLIEILNIALPEMKNNNFGRISVITSIAAREPLDKLTTSNSLRAGLNGLIKTVSTEYAPYGITLNNILPGYTNTDRLKQLNLTDEWIKNAVPAARLGEPEEVADLVAFLSSSKGGYITGQNIAIDGGVLKGHY